MKVFWKKFWYPIVFALAMVFGFLVIGQGTYEAFVVGLNPYMIVDMSVPSAVSPAKYEPVEMTGLPVEQGIKKQISCKVPTSYMPYVHYPSNWAYSPFNPTGKIGQFTKWALYVILVLVVGLLTWRIVKIVKAKNKRKIGGV